jgi:hypothetical protein
MWQGLALCNIRSLPKSRRNFAACFKFILMAMQKAGIYRLQKPVCETGEISPANTKVSRANVQSRPCGILLSSDNGKLYFAALKILSVPQNNLPLQGWKRSEVAFPSKTITTKIPNYMTTEKNKPRQVGRKPKADPCRHRLSFNLNDTDYQELLTLFEQSGLPDRARFIASCVFKREWKVVKIDKATMDYYMRLTTFYAQFRAIGNNYNQVTKALKSTFTEKKALAFLYKLEKATLELVAINQKIIDLTKEFEAKYLNK